MEREDALTVSRTVVDVTPAGRVVRVRSSGKRATITGRAGMVFLALMAATFISEDLAGIGAGLLIREGRIGFWAGVAACALGILAGDVGLWYVGRISRRIVGRWPVLVASPPTTAAR